MDILIKVGQLILALAILVTVHEFGHYLAARAFKTRVEKFYLFFNPWFSVFKKKIGDTEWGFGWLPWFGANWASTPKPPMTTIFNHQPKPP